MKRLQPRLTLILPTIIVLLLSSFAMTFASPIAPNMLTTMTPPPSPTTTAPLKPLVLLTIYDPWRMVIGSDEPTFALYVNGLVIYQRLGPADAPEFASVQLTAAELKTLKAELKIDKTLYTLDADEGYFTKTDQPTNVIRLFDPVLGEKTVSIYGDLRHDEEARQMAAPKRLIDLFDALANYGHPDATTWLPDHFEVVLYAYDKASDSVAWPSNWPTLTDPTTIKRDSVYSLYIDIKDFDRYLQLRDESNAVRLDERTWAYSVRYPFPHERKIA